MAHRTVRSSYDRLVDRLNRFPQGAPPSSLLFDILRMLFSEREAELASMLPIKPFGADKAARIWRMTVAEARAALDELASRGILVDSEQEGELIYTLPPPMAGFFEFSLMRVRGDIDQKLLSELFYQYLNVEEAFIKALFVDGETQLGRIFVNEDSLPEDDSLTVLEYERASEVIRTASHRAVGICYCRHKMDHLKRSCDTPLDICMTFNTVASSLIRHGIARTVDERESLDLLGQAREHNLVQFGENVRRDVSFICNCCGCCCEALLGYKRFGSMRPIHTHYLPEIDGSTCNGCGRCVAVCPIDAISLDGDDHGEKRARIDETVCLGCGVCQRNCSRGSIRMVPHPQRLITPVDSVHRVVLMAIERGTLQHLIFDNHALRSHRALAAILGVILRLPPLKQALASRQMKSRYLEYLISRFKP